MRKLLFPYIGLFLVIFLSSMASDEALLRTLRSKLNSYLTTNPQERIYITLSQPFYVTGDRLWYSLNQVNLKTNTPESLSGSAYVRLCNEIGTPVFKQIIKLNAGKGFGDFIIPDSLPTGRYTIAAQTNWMRNFPHIKPFQQSLTIIDLADSLLLQTPADTSNNIHQKVNPQPLPGLPSKVRLTVEEADDGQVIAKIAAPQRYLGARYSLIIQSKGSVEQVSSGAFKAQEDVVIPEQSIETGLNQFTLFDDAGTTLVQHLFVKEFSAGQYITLDRDAYNTRDLVSVNLDLSEFIDGQASSSLAVVVRDRKLFPVDGSAGEQTTYPEAFVNDRINLISESLLFDWDSIQSIRSKRMKFNMEEGFSISGQIFLENGVEKLDKSSIILSKRGEEPQFHHQFLYDTVRFTFKELSFTGSEPFNIQVVPKQPIEDQISFQIENELVGFEKVQAVPISKDMQEYVRKKRIIAQLEKAFRLDLEATNDATVQDDKKLPADDVRQMSDYLPFADMNDIIREILPNVKMKKNKVTKEYELKIFDRESFTQTRKASFMIDGVLVLDQNVILEMDVDNLQSIQIFRSRKNTDTFGPFGWGGLMALYTHNEYYSKLPHLTFGQVRLMGFHAPNDFDSLSPSANGEIPNLNPVMFWQPDIQIDSTGQGSFEFYTNDAVGDYEIIVQGITSAGTPVRLIKTFEVSYTELD